MSRYNDHEYRKKLAALRRTTQRTGGLCWLCGKPFDYDLPPHHPMAFTGDHVQAIANGGRMTGELRPAHRSCNSRRGKRRTEDQIQRPKTTRAW